MKHFPGYGWQKFRARFCYDRAKQRVIFGGQNITWVTRTKLGDLSEFKISNERKDNTSIMGGRGVVISNFSTIEVCGVTGAVCSHRETTFKVRAYWDGGYQWRINDTLGQVSGPP